MLSWFQYFFRNTLCHYGNLRPDMYYESMANQVKQHICQETSFAAEDNNKNYQSTKFFW